MNNISGNISGLPCVIVSVHVKGGAKRDTAADFIERTSTSDGVRGLVEEVRATATPEQLKRLGTVQVLYKRLAYSPRRFVLDGGVDRPSDGLIEVEFFPGDQKRYGAPCLNDLFLFVDCFISIQNARVKKVPAQGVQVDRYHAVFRCGDFVRCVSPPAKESCEK